MAILISSLMDFGSTMAVASQLNPASKVHHFLPKISSLNLMAPIFTARRRIPSLTIINAYQRDPEQLSFISEEHEPVKVQLYSTLKPDNFKEPDPLPQSLEIIEERKLGSSKSKEKISEIQTSVDLLQVLRYPLTTESAIKQIVDENTLVFIVDVRANKKTIRRAFESTFEIKSKRVNTLINFDGTKKAFITLSSDYSALDFAKRVKIL